MVHLVKSGNLRPEPETASGRKNGTVKLEIVDDFLEEEHGPLSKRSKASPSLQQQWGMESNVFPVPPSQYNPLDEPSPLGLRLRKSPSLLDLIQMRLSQGSDSTVGTSAQTDDVNSVVKKESKGTAASASLDKLKASNFPAKHLKIGSWEYKSRYEGDLVAKCYFAKHKLVWEVLDGGLKSKIEIQWSDIMGLKANCPDNGSGTLIIVLARQPLFFRETNPQPRKHTLWQATSDFTDGQASRNRQHVLECSQGLLNKHFEKLIQCDTRLNFLSQQPEIIIDSPYFEPRSSVFEDPEASKAHDFNQIKSGGMGSTFSGFQDLVSPAVAHSSSFEMEPEKGDPGSSLGSVNMSREAPSPSSVMDNNAIEGSGIGEAVDSRGPRNWDEIKVPGLHPSMSMGDLMNHIGHRLTGQVTSGNQQLSENGPEYHEILEDIAQYLLSDTQSSPTSDEKSLMSRVNSLCCLLQKDPTTTATTSQNNWENCNSGQGDVTAVPQINSHESIHIGNTRGDMMSSNAETTNVSTNKQPMGMSRKDSFGDLLLHLPRIASLPKFLFNISEEDDTRGR